MLLALAVHPLLACRLDLAEVGIVVLLLALEGQLEGSWMPQLGQVQVRRLAAVH